MTGSEAIDLLMGRLGDRSDADLRASCLLELNLAQSTTLERGTFLPWFLITEDATAVLTVGERRLPVPSDFLRETEEDEGGLVIYDLDGVEQDMTKRSRKENLDHWGSTATGDVPTDYSLVGGYYLIYPLPNYALTVKMKYKASQTVIADTSMTNVWLTYAPDWLIGEAGIVLAALHARDDQDIVSYFQAMRDRGYNRALVDETAREEANQDRAMG